MRTTALGSTAMARAALAGLALGLAALAALAVSSTVSNQHTTAQVREMNEISDRWGRIFQKTTLEGEALHAFLGAGSPEARKPLASALGGADTDLDWLLQRGDRKDVEAAKRIRQTYLTYTAALRDVVQLGEQGDLVAANLQADLGELAASSLRKQISQLVAAKRNQTTQYLLQADQANQKLQNLAWVAFTVDLGLLGLFSLVLLENQRRIRRQAAQSGHDARHDGLTAERRAERPRRRSPRRPARPAPDRPRQIQGGQRHPRPSRRRPPTQADRPTSADGGPRRGPGSPPRR